MPIETKPTQLDIEYDKALEFFVADAMLKGRETSKKAVIQEALEKSVSNFNEHLNKAKRILATEKKRKQ